MNRLSAWALGHSFDYSQAARIKPCASRFASFFSTRRARFPQMQSFLFNPQVLRGNRLDPSFNKSTALTISFRRYFIYNSSEKRNGVEDQLHGRAAMQFCL
jgi:hypothetical protein